MAATRGAFRPLWRPASTALFSPRPILHTRPPLYAPPVRLFQSTARPRQYRRGFNYQRFQSTSSLLQRWIAQPTFYYQLAGIGGTVGLVYSYNLEEVPVSHRRRYNIVSEDYEVQSGRQLYAQVMREYGGQILPAWHPKAMMVQRVLDRLIPHSGLAADKNRWEVHVIEDEQKNAFVIPGGKVFVFSGILDVCQGEDGLAAVLGHEIAHNVAHHAAEKMSQSSVVMLVAFAASWMLGVGDMGLTRVFVDLGFLRPNGRKQESEADYIGLMMMSQACFNPEAAIGLWSRMAQEEMQAPPQFLSTHPSSHNRMGAIREWLPQAREKGEQAGCRALSGYAQDFKHAVSWGS